MISYNLSSSIFTIFSFFSLRIEIHLFILAVTLFRDLGSLQVISDTFIMNILAYLRNLGVLALCYCLGDISMLSFSLSMQNLRKLRLERETPWMTNNDLVILTQNCANLDELSLLGCKLLNSGQESLFVKYNLHYSAFHVLESSYCCFMIQVQISTEANERLWDPSLIGSFYCCMVDISLFLYILSMLSVSL